MLHNIAWAVVRADGPADPGWRWRPVCSGSVSAELLTANMAAGVFRFCVSRAAHCLVLSAATPTWRPGCDVFIPPAQPSNSPPSIDEGRG